MIKHFKLTYINHTFLFYLYIRIYSLVERIFRGIKDFLSRVPESVIKEFLT